MYAKEAPHRGAGIEIVAGTLIETLNTEAPPRGAGIEIGRACRPSHCTVEAPHRGAGIEIGDTLDSLGGVEKPLTEGLVLKYYCRRCRFPDCEAPHRGAGIEIMTDIQNAYQGFARSPSQRGWY